MLQLNILTLGVVFPLVCNCLSILSVRAKFIGEDKGHARLTVKMNRNGKIDIHRYSKTELERHFFLYPNPIPTPTDGKRSLPENTLTSNPYYPIHSIPYYP